MLRRSTTKKKATPKKKGRRRERVDLYMRKEVQKLLDRLRRKEGKRAKPVPRSTYVADLIKARAAEVFAAQQSPETSPS